MHVSRRRTFNSPERSEGALMGFNKPSSASYCVMAIYSLHHSPIGRTTHRAGTAGAHLRYITRRSAEAVTMANGMPEDPAQAMQWLQEQEAGDRKNARVADRVMIALPRELTKKQRIRLVRVFLRELTGDLVPWFVAVHQEGDDSTNPHAHIVIRDKSILRGRRVLLTSEKGSTAKIRAKWSQAASMALEMHGYDGIDHRSYRERGVDRLPTRHRGPDRKRMQEPPLRYGGSVSLKRCANVGQPNADFTLDI